MARGRNGVDPRRGVSRPRDREGFAVCTPSPDGPAPPPLRHRDRAPDPRPRARRARRRPRPHPPHPARRADVARGGSRSLRPRARGGAPRRRAARGGRSRRGLPPVLRGALHDQGSVRARRDAQHRRARRAEGAPSERRRDGREAPARGRGDPARGDEPVRAVHVDGEREPSLRPHEQRLRPVAHGGRELGRRGGDHRRGRFAVRARLGRRRVDPHARVLQRRLRAQAERRAHPEQRAVSDRRERRAPLPGPRVPSAVARRT